MLDLEFFYLHFFIFDEHTMLLMIKKQCKKGRDLHLLKTSLILVNSPSFLMEISLIFDLGGWHLWCILLYNSEVCVCVCIHDTLYVIQVPCVVSLFIEPEDVCYIVSHDYVL